MDTQEDVFDDLPQEEGTTPAPEGEEPKIEPEDKSNEEVQKLQRDLDHARTMIKEKDKVAREERERRKKESDERRRLEAELKKRDAGTTEDEEDEEETTPSTQIAQQPIDPKEIAKQAKQELRADMYNDEVIKVIKSRPGITRQEAKEVLEIVNKLPKSGDAALDADFAFDYRTKMQNRDRGGFTPPAPTGGGGVTRASAAPGTVSQGAIELGKQFGVSKEDFAKFGGELKI